MRIDPLKSRRALAAATTAMALVFAPGAHADVGETIILRCTHGQSLSGFSQRAYSRALKELSADAEEYSPCSGMIRQAQQAAASGEQSSPTGSTQSGPAAATVASPAEKKAVARALSTGSAPVSLGGQIVHPGVVHADIASAFSSLPTPLLATLALLLACLLVAVGALVRNRVRAGRTD